MSNSKQKKLNVSIVLVACKIAVSFGLLFLLFRRIDFGMFLEHFQNLQWEWLMLVVVIFQIQSLLSVLKWKTILSADGEIHKYFFLWKTCQIGSFLSLFLPTSFGGDAYRVWALNQTGAKMSKSVASVLFDRFSGVLALLTIGMIGASMLLEQLHLWIVGIIYVLFIAGIVIVTSDTVNKRLPQPSSKYLGFPFRVLRSFNFYRKSGGKLVATLALSGLFQINVVVIVSCYARALQVSPDEVSFGEMLATVPVVYLTEMLPISINGIGVRDGAFAFFFERVGGTAEQGLAVSLLVIVIRYIKGLPGGILLLVSTICTRRNTRRRSESVIAVEQAGVTNQP